MKKIKILVIGAGLAGCSAAYLLERDGHEVRLIERGQEAGFPGYVVDLYGVGLKVIEELGLNEELLRHSKKFKIVGRHSYLNKSLERVEQISLKDLKSLFIGKLKTQIQYETTVEKIETSSSAVKVELSSGEQEKYDLTIVCEGVHSITREKLFPEVIVEDLGIYFMTGVKEVLEGFKNDEVKIHDNFGQWRMEYMLEPDQKAIFHMAHQGIKEAEDYDHMYKGKLEIVKCIEAYKGRVVLLGDALGCVSPLSGQGAGQAMYQAYVLSQLFTREESIISALEKYKAEVVPNIQRIQKDVYKISRFLLPPTRWRYWIRNCVCLPLARVGVFAKFFKKLEATSPYVFLEREKSRANK